MLRRTLDWLDDRAGYRKAMAVLLEEPVSGGASFAYVWGSVLAFVLLLQMGTGVLLATYYSPSASDAWASVAYIQDTVTLGWFVRGLHSYGASAMVIVSGVHMLQTALYGAYKKPRELNWIVGVLMLGLIMAFALTGYLLPWDQTGYWATKVATGIAGSTPIAGSDLQQLAQGGNEYGNLTLTRFYAIHVFLLPATMLALTGVHLLLFRRHGVTPRWGRSAPELEKTTQPFWPDQLLRDVVAMAAIFAVMIGLVVSSHGASLDAPADPSSSFDARPEWYFRPLFQLLKYFEGPMEHVVALGTPVVVAFVLLGLPFADRGESRDPRRRLPYLGVLTLGVAGTILLTFVSLHADSSDKSFAEKHDKAERSARRARELASQYGVPAEGGVAVFTTAPHYRARRLFKQHCAGCHVGNERKGPEIGPGWGSREWLRAFMLDPSGPRFFGPTKIDDMKPVPLRGVDLDAVIEMVYAESGAPDANPTLAASGRKLFDDGDCSNCHSIGGTGEDDVGPDLAGHGSAKVLAEFLADPSHPRFFGEANEMPKFAEKMGPDDRRQMAELLVWLRTATPADLAE